MPNTAVFIKHVFLFTITPNILVNTKNRRRLVYFCMYCCRVGLIEWMENTCVLKDFIKNTMTKEEQKTKDK